ncbi:single-stranded DNA-binding protein [bacterium]|nr:single-stranded DNA-binding protein [bacterium]
MGKFLKKGTPVVIEGKIDRRNFINKDGNNVYVTEIIVENIKSFGYKKQGNNSEKLVSVEEKFDHDVVDQQVDFNKSNEQGKNNSTINDTSKMDGLE